MKRLLLTLSFCCTLPLLAQVPGFSPQDLARLTPAVESGGTPAPNPDILWWPMLDGSGGVITVTGVQTPRGVTDADWVTGKSGSGFALEFNGTTDDAYTANIGTTPVNLTYGTNQITATAWVFLDDTNTIQTILESNTSWSAGDGRFVWYVNAGTIIGSMRGVGASKLRTESVTAPQTNGWVHLALVMDNSTVQGNFIFYIDGETVVETVTNNGKDAASDFLANPLYVGARNAGASQWLNGKLEDLRIYTGQLSQAQVQAIMNDPQ